MTEQTQNQHNADGGQSRSTDGLERQWPKMGFGKVAIGSCDLPCGGRGLLYLDMRGEQREINEDTTDLYPIGSELDPGSVLARVDFATADAVRQTIQVLEEMEREMRVLP